MIFFTVPLQWRKIFLQDGVYTMNRFATLLFSSLFFLVLGVSSGAWASQVSDNARASGVKACADLLTRETASLENNPSVVTSDFVAPGGQENADSNPFFSVALMQGGAETGPIHVTTTASPSGSSQKKGGFFSSKKDDEETKCSLQISETFVYSNPCEALSLQLSNVNFQSRPLGNYVTLMTNVGTENRNPYDYFYLTQVNQGNSCLVTRRKIRYAQ